MPDELRTKTSDIMMQRIFSPTYIVVAYKVAIKPPVLQPVYINFNNVLSALKKILVMPTSKELNLFYLLQIAVWPWKCHYAQ